MSLSILLPSTVVAQAPRGAVPSAPLRDEPGDWWGDVHRWTGSDATRPRAGPSTGPARPSRRTVTTLRTGRANIRRAPATTAPVARVVPPGTVLNVFAEGPEGWLHVGEGDRPVGWIHPSALVAP